MIQGTVGFGLLSALSWGSSDFAGGVAARRLSILVTLVGGQSFGLAAALLALILARESAPPGPALFFAALAGLTGLVGLASLYRALAIGPMGVVAPSVGVLAAAIPAATGALRGDGLSVQQGLGLVAALTAVAIASLPRAMESGSSTQDRTCRVATGPWRLIALGGVAFAGFYLLLDQARAAGAIVWWPVAAARTASLASILAFALLSRRAFMPARAQLPLLLGIGAGDLGGNVFFVLANAIGPLSIAAVLSSLYPVVTVVLAALLLGERLGRIQLAGVGLALVGIVLITI